MFKKNKGITLIALVITIIILLILAGITITQLIGNGLFEKVQLAKEKSENAQNAENVTLSDYENKIDSYLSNNRDGGNISINELLENSVIIETSTSEVNINKDFSLKSSIENYKFLLFTFGLDTSHKWQQTLFIPVDQIKYQESGDSYSIELEQHNGPTGFSHAFITFKNATTGHIGNTQTNNTTRGVFTIYSIKGIK